MDELKLKQWALEKALEYMRGQKEPFLPIDIVEIAEEFYSFLKGESDEKEV